MDLFERNKDVAARHPWELARLSAIRSLMKDIPVDEKNYHVLDLGCGDGFISDELFRNMHVESITGIDTNLSSKEISHFNNLRNNIRYFNDYSCLKDKYYRLILLLDVIEHIEDDKSFLFDIANKYIVDNGHIVITAPAFQRLYSSHDRFLKHYRRYSRRSLVDLVKYARLECLSSGYLFVSLLPIRFVLSFCGRILRNDGKNQTGIGAWKHHRWITKALEAALNEDVRISLALNNLGITLPGLTVWAVCRKPLS